VDFYTFDDDYVRRLREGDPWTVEHFQRYFTELMLVKLHSRRHPVEAIEDVLQEVFHRFFRALGSPGGIRSGKSLGPYVNSVCNHVLLEGYRRKRDSEPLDPDAEIPDKNVSALDAIINDEMKRKVGRVLAELEPKDAAMLRAIFLEERDKDEVCLEYGVKRDYLRVLLFRAKKNFRSAYLGLQEVTEFHPRDTETAKPSLLSEKKNEIETEKTAEVEIEKKSEAEKKPDGTR
jgi:RNA polymerase sigma-70 factor (ECF subfamily)